MQTALLSIPAAGERTHARLSRKVQLLAVRFLLTLPPGALPERPSALVAVQRALTREIKKDSARVLRAIASPDVLPPLMLARINQWPTDDALRRAIPSLLAHLGETTEAVLWDVPVDFMTDGQTLWRFDPAAEGITIDPTGVAIRPSNGPIVRIKDHPGEHPFHALPGGLHLASWDSFPLADVEEHPDKDGNQLDFGDHPLEEWVSAMAEALELVRVGLPEWFAELPGTCQRLVPVGYLPEKHLSASYREAPNTVFLTLHPSKLTLAEAIVHEVQHGKLNTALLLDPMLVNGRTFWTDSPVRPDLRPLIGVLLAVHAFVPVAAMHHAIADREEFRNNTAFGQRRAQVLQSNQRGLDILLESGETTDLGQRVLDDLAALHQLLVEAAPELPEPRNTEMVG